MAVEIDEKDLNKTINKKKKFNITEKIVDTINKIPDSIKEVGKIITNLKDMKQKQSAQQPQSIKNFNAKQKAEAITEKMFQLIDKYKPYVAGKSLNEIIPLLNSNKNKIIAEIEEELKNGI